MSRSSNGPLDGLTLPKVLAPSQEEVAWSALASAKEKVRAKAAHYDRSRAGAPFADTKTLTPAEIQYKLRYLFGIYLTKLELTALVRDFDRDGDGSIDNAEFQVAFFRLAQEGKDRIIQEKLRRQRNLRGEKERSEKERAEELVRRTQIDLCDYSMQDLENVQAHVAKVAETYDVELEEAMGPALKVFEGHMNPTEFKEQLRKSLNIELSLPELSALFEHCDRDKSGSIEGAEFKFEFLRLRRQGALNAKRRLERANKRINTRMANLESECLKRFNRNSELVVSYDFTPEDQKRALEYIAKAAAHFDPSDYRNRDVINAFNQRLDPPALREQLVRCFDIRLTSHELGALVQYVDRDQNGFVEGAEFWIAFSKVGDRYREKIRLQENEQNEKRRAAINNFAQKLADEKAERRRLAKLAKKKESIYPSYDGPRLAVEYRCDDGITIEDAQTIHQLGIKPDNDKDQYLKEICGDLDVHFRDSSRMDESSTQYGEARGFSTLPEPRLLGNEPLSSDVGLDQVIRASISALQQRTGLHVGAEQQYLEASAKRKQMEEERIASLRPEDRTALIYGPGPPKTKE